MNTAGNSASNYSSKFTVEGNSYIVWGTDGIYPPSIVVTANEEARVDKTTIMQGTGFTAILILLLDGYDVDIELIQDTSIPGNAIGSVATLSTPYGSIPMVCEKSKYSQSRKTEGHVTYNFASYNAIAGLH